MNHDLEHEELVWLLNRRVQIKAENERMEMLGRRYAPLFWCVLCFAAAVILWGIL